MKEIRYTLVSDGSSDRVLIPLLTWLLREQQVRMPIQPEWADLRNLRQPPSGLVERIKSSLDLYPCDLLFVHRDAERAPHEVRRAEIQKAMAQIALPDFPPTVCVVPVRMQEAWLIFNEVALRKASGNAHGTMRLNLPRLSTVEDLPDPKHQLFELLREASGQRGRRRTHLPVRNLVHRVAEFIEDYTPLRILPAFQALEMEIIQIVTEHKWNV
jgi:hypothetical protein